MLAGLSLTDPLKYIPPLHTVRSLTAVDCCRLLAISPPKHDENTNSKDPYSQGPTIEEDER